LSGLDDRVRAGLEAQLRDSEPRIGWKIGLNDPRVQQALGIDRPVIGHLPAAARVGTGEAHSLGGATRPAIEPEIAVHVGAGGAVAGLGPALELIDVDLAFDDLTAVLAGNVFHRAVVLGPATPGRTTVDGLTASFQGQEIDVTAACMDPREVIALVSGYLEPMGESLHEGDVIIAGSLVTALPAAAGDRFELEVGELGSVALELTP
jgi:2-keto-4-pentenoate hydratase